MVKSLLHGLKKNFVIVFNNYKNKQKNDLDQLVFDVLSH